jgi:GTPase SAR1 family protein
LKTSPAEIESTVSYTCRIYGLGLKANLLIAGLRGLPPTSEIDVDLWLGLMPDDLADLRADEVQEYRTGSALDEQGEPFLRVSSLRNGLYLRLSYSDGTVFVIDAGYQTIWATWPEPATLEDTATYLLGPVLGYLLRLRGITCLHASAVAIGGCCIALVGPAGAGKSSTAAAFARMGFPVLSDDVVALGIGANGFVVQPAYPRIRLWPESVHGMFGSPEALPRITPTWGKRFLDLNGDGYRFQATALPLAAVYFLGERTITSDVPLVDAISSREAIMTLVSDTYGTRLLDLQRRAKEFEVLGELVGKVPVRQVRASTDIARIPELCKAISDDFQRLTTVGS